MLEDNRQGDTMEIDQEPNDSLEAQPQGSASPYGLWVYKSTTASFITARLLSYLGKDESHLYTKNIEYLRISFPIKPYYQSL